MPPDVVIHATYVQVFPRFSSRDPVSTPNGTAPAMHIRPENLDFILVEPQHPGNIGASARALNTMGFSRLVLVNPPDLDAPEARYMAHASEHILDNARVVSDLRTALEGVHWAIATTQRDREYHFPFFTPTELGPKILPITQEQRVAIVFGRERTGLTNEEIQLCQAISTIPARVNHPSLNLSQAVMIYAYECFRTTGGEAARRFKLDLAEYEVTEGVYDHLERSLRRTGFVPLDSWEKFMMRFRRLFGRAHPEHRDVMLLHKIIQAYDYHINGLEARIRALEEKESS